MRILHLDTGREIRGGQRQLQLLMRGLERHGVDQMLLARGVLAESESTEKLTASAVRRQARKADLIHAHDARSHTIAALVSPGAPLVVSRRVAFPPRRDPLSRWKYARADLFLAVSEFVAVQLRQAGVADERIQVVHDGVEAPDAPLGRPSGDLLKAGILEIDDPLKLNDLALASCRRAGVAHFADGCLERVLDNSDFLLYLTAEEGLGSALIAAAARGRPAVASRVGGVPEVVEHERTGLLVDNDAAEIAVALQRFAEDRELLGACASAAFERAGARFSGDMMVTRTLEAYRELLQSKS